MKKESVWSILKSSAYKLLNPIVYLFRVLGFTPNMITTIGLIINIVAAGILLYGAEYGERGDHRYLTWFGIIILLAGVFDMLDGQLARNCKKESRFGALYDSVLDRYSELFAFLGICYYLISHDYFLSSLFAFIALIGSLMVSYIRARAGSLGIDCKIGLMQRPERILTIGISAILYGVITHYFGDITRTVEWLPIPIFENISIFTIPIFIMAVLTNYTAIQRINHCYKKMTK